MDFPVNLSLTQGLPLDSPLDPSLWRLVRPDPSCSATFDRAVEMGGPRPWIRWNSPHPVFFTHSVRRNLRGGAALGRSALLCSGARVEFGLFPLLYCKESRSTQVNWSQLPGCVRTQQVRFCMGQDGGGLGLLTPDK